MTGHEQSDVKCYGESNDGKHVTLAHCTKKFLRKPRKSREIHEYSKIWENKAFIASLNFKKL